MSASIFSSRAAVDFGWREFWVRPWFWLGIVLVFVFVLGLNLLSDRFIPKAAPVQQLIVTLLFMLLNQFLAAGWIRICLNIHDGEAVAFSTLFSSFAAGCRALLATAFIGLGLVVPAVVILVFLNLVTNGNMVFLVPAGVILALALSYVMARVIFYVILIVDRGLGAMASLNTCFAMTRGQVWPIALFWTVIMGVHFLGLLSLVVGIAVTIPLAMLAKVFVYRKLAAVYFSPAAEIEGAS